MRKGLEDGEDAFDVFNSVQDHVLLAARAHIDREVLELFVAAVDRCTDPTAAQLLSDLCDLHALALIERERGWFMEHGRLTPARAKAVTTAVNELCGKIRADAALRWSTPSAIPDVVLAAPIALGDEERRQARRVSPLQEPFRHPPFYRRAGRVAHPRSGVPRVDPLAQPRRALRT